MQLLKKVILSGVLLFVIGLIRIQAQTVTDVDGNVYNTVTIGMQVWMAENLKTTKYNEGTAISLITNNTTWKNSITGAYCWYNNNEATYKNVYGAYYNFYAVGTNKLCPTGWHVPTDVEWATLSNYLGGNSVAGGKMKETGTTHWISPNAGATNESGFTALPGGFRSNGDGTFGNIGLYSFWWISTIYDGLNSWNLSISNTDGFFATAYYGNTNGFNVRCLRDLSTDITNPSTSIIEIYPNPVSGILTIEYKNENFKTVTILNSRGALLTKEMAISPIQQLDFSKYIPGLYFLEFAKATGEIKRLKVVKH